MTLLFRRWSGALGVLALVAAVVGLSGAPDPSAAASPDVRAQQVDESDGALTLNDGGQFVFWSFGPFDAANIFGTVKIAWLFDPGAVTWTAFIPALGTVNFPLADGDVLWIVSEGDQVIDLAGDVVTADDGSATLTIPPGALPEGVSPADIRILPADRGEALAAFELLPDGLTFAAPVTLTLSLEEGVEGAVILLISSDGAVELLDTAISEDPETGGLSLSARLSHFSFSYGIDLMGVMDTDLALADARPQVGEQFDATVEIDLGSGASGTVPDPLTGEPLFVFFQPVSDAGFLAGGRLTAEGPLDPATVDDLPADRSDPGTTAPFFFERAMFTCLTPGAFSLNYAGEAELTIGGSVLPESGDLRSLKPRVVTVRLRDVVRDECGPNPTLAWENVYTPFDDTNVYTAGLLDPFDELDADTSTVEWILINSVCGDPRRTGEFSYAYSHGINSADGEGPLSSCSLPQEEVFSLAFVVTLTLRSGGACEFSYLQETARALQNRGPQNVQWTGLFCDLPGG